MLLTTLFFALSPVVLAQECSFSDEISYRTETTFKYNTIEGDPPQTYITSNHNIHPSDDCSYFSAIFGYQGRQCLSCGVPSDRTEFIGALTARATAETAFGRELSLGRIDLLDIGFLDGEGERVEEHPFDWTLFEAVSCTCDSEPVEGDKGTCATGAVCTTTGVTEYGSVSATFVTSTVGNVGSLQVNVSIVHETLEGSPFFAVGVPQRFKTFEEENGSFVIGKEGIRMVFDSTCGENTLSLESIVPEEEERLAFMSGGATILPMHNRVLFNVDGTNLTCDWSYAIEVDLEETSAAAPVVTSSLLVALVATLFM
jgi:hypothetical protein